MDIHHSLACLSTRVNKLEFEVLKYHKDEYEKKEIEVQTELTIPSRDDVNKELLKALHAELASKNIELKKVIDDIDLITELSEDDDKTVATDHAIEELERIDMGVNPAVVHVNDDCKECIKKKYKLWQRLQKDLKKQEKLEKRSQKQKQRDILENEKNDIMNRLAQLGNKNIII